MRYFPTSPDKADHRPRAWFSACVAGWLLGMIAATSVVHGQESTGPVKPDAVKDRQGRQASLRDQLRVGLKAVTKADLAFIDLVVQKVNEGKLPRKLVDSTFLWARNRHRTRPTTHPLRPMVYFQPALVLRAKAIGVKL
jgi:hypothetical protein